MDTSSYILFGLIIMEFILLNELKYNEKDFVFHCMRYMGNRKVYTLAIFRFLSTFLSYFSLFSYLKQYGRLSPISHGVTSKHATIIVFFIFYFIVFLCILMMSLPEVNLYQLYVQYKDPYFAFMNNKYIGGNVDKNLMKRITDMFNSKSKYLDMYVNLVNTQFYFLLFAYSVTGVISAITRRR